MNCFYDLLNTVTEANRSDASGLTRRLLLELVTPILVAVLVTAILVLFADQVQDQELVIFSALKIASIVVHAIHTVGSTKEAASTGYYTRTVFWMAGTCLFLAIYITGVVLLDLIADDTTMHGGAFEKIHSFFHSMYTLFLITIFSFVYMFDFLFANLEVIGRNNGNYLVVQSTRAFIYGVNYPSITAFVLIVLTLIACYGSQEAWPQHHFPFMGGHDARTFLEGAVAFLIYSSTVASIFVDHYTKPLRHKRLDPFRHNRGHICEEAGGLPTTDPPTPAHGRRATVTMDQAVNLSS